MTGNKRRLCGVIFFALLYLFCVAQPAFAAGSADRAAIWKTYDHTTDEIFLDAVINGVTDVYDDKYGLTKDTYQNRFIYLMSVNPEFIGCTDLAMSYILHTGQVVGYTLYYCDNYPEVRKAFEAALPRVRAEVDALIPENATDFDKVHLVHDYLISSTAYDQGPINEGRYVYYDYDASGVFVQHVSVCQGYSMAFKYIMDYLNIPCAVAKSSKADHAWNLVNLGDEWYHVDVTADDHSWDVLGYVAHDYLCISTETLLSKNANRSDFVFCYEDYTFVFTDDLYGKDKSYERNDYLWSGSRSGCYYHNGDWYTVKNNMVMKNGQLFYQVDGLMSWHPNGQTYASYKNGLELVAKIVGIGDYLYLNSPEYIYRIDISGDTAQAQLYYMPELAEGEQIFGLGVIEGQLYYTVEKDYPRQMETHLLLPEPVASGTVPHVPVIEWVCDSDSIAFSSYPWSYKKLIVARYDKTDGRFLGSSAIDYLHLRADLDLTKEDCKIFYLDQNYVPLSTEIEVRME